MVDGFKSTDRSQGLDGCTLVFKRVFMNISPRLEIEARGIRIACYLFHSFGKAAIYRHVLQKFNTSHVRTRFRSKLSTGNCVSKLENFTSQQKVINYKL